MTQQHERTIYTNILSLILKYYAQPPLYLAITCWIVVMLASPFILFGQESTQDWRNNPELANYLSKAAGAKIHSASSTDSSKSFFVENIIDPTTGKAGLWRTAPKKKPPQWVIIELPEPRMLTTFMVNLKSANESKYQGVSARVVKIEFSMVSPYKGFRRVGREYLHKGKDLQLISVESSKAQWVRVTIEGNWDFPFFAELGRVYAYNDVVMNQYESELMNLGSLTVKDIHFDLNSAKLKAKSLPIIESVAMALHSNPSWQIIIEGHTDKTGDQQYNQELSLQRAQAVANALQHVGISKARLETIGYGASKPEKTGNDPTAMQENRRVIFRIKKE